MQENIDNAGLFIIPNFVKEDDNEGILYLKQAIDGIYNLWLIK